MDMTIKDAVQQVFEKVEGPVKKMIGKLVVNVGGVRAYKLNNGKVRFQAQCSDVDVVARDPKGRKVISKSFDSREDAEKWLDELRGNSRPLVAVPEKMRMAEAFKLYVEECARHGSPLSQGQVFMFDRLSKHPMLMGVLVSEMRLKHASDYCSYRKNVDGIHTSTIMTEFIRINVALRRLGAWLEWGQKNAPFNPLAGAVEVLKQQKLVSDSRKRTRRPSGLELARLLEYFRANRCGPGGCGIDIPMADIIEFAALNAFRLGEIARMKWSDLRPGGYAIGIHRKDSSAQDGGRRASVVPLIKSALAVIERQPRVDGEERIFPYCADTISQRFADACKKLGIADLRFHDLRHEAISRLASVLGIADAMLISGHKTTRAFLRYVNLEEEAARVSKDVSSKIVSLKEIEEIRLAA